MRIRARAFSGANSASAAAYAGSRRLSSRDAAKSLPMGLSGVDPACLFMRALSRGQVITSDNHVKTEWVLRRVMAGSPRRAADRCVHSRPIVSPALVGYLDVRRRQAINSLVQEVEEHEYVVGSPVEDPIVRSPGVGSKLVELAGNVARPRGGGDWSELRGTLDVVVDCDMVVRTQPEGCVVDRLSTADVEPHAFVRELIQNALDATRCRLYEDLRSMGEPTPNDPTRVPEAGRSVLPIRVGLRWVEVENELSGLLESRQELSVEDRGIGMDEEIITRYLLQVGRSYYATPQFLRRYDFTPTSRFGVGVLSVFADSDHVLVDTYRPSSAAAAPISLLLTGPRQYILTKRGARTQARD